MQNINSDNILRLNRKRRENRRSKQSNVEIMIRNRTKEDRQSEATKIIQSLQTLNLNPGDYEPIRVLYNLLRTYIQDGERIEVNIPFPEIHKQIVGVLAIRLTEPVVVKLTKEL